MISHWEIGCGDFQTIKYANARSSPSPSRNGHLGIFQSLTSFVFPSFAKSLLQRKQTPRFLLD